MSKGKSSAQAVVAGQQSSQLAGSNVAPFLERDILLQTDAGVEVHKVEGQNEQLLARAPLVCYAVIYPTGERRMACEVADVRWWLLTTTASLKVAPLTFMMAMPGERVFYSITFAEDTPPEAIGAFEALLEEVTVYRESERLMADPAVEHGDRVIAEGMVGRYDGLRFENKWADRMHQTSMKVADGVLMASARVASKMEAQSAAAQARTPPNQNPRPVSHVVMMAASGARQGANALAYMADKAVNVVSAVPVYVADRLVGHGSSGKPGKPPGTTKQMVTASAVSFTVVWTAMEASARTVLVGARDAASGVVGHRYGPDAGVVAADTMTAGGHLANAYTSYRNIAARAVMRKTAKVTAKKMLSSYMGRATPNGMDPREAARLSVKERMNEISARGGAQIAADDPAASNWDGATNAHMAMHRWHSSKGLLQPEVPQPMSPLAEAPPPVAQLKTSKSQDKGQWR